MFHAHVKILDDFAQFFEFLSASTVLQTKKCKFVAQESISVTQLDFQLLASSKDFYLLVSSRDVRTESSSGWLQLMYCFRGPSAASSAADPFAPDREFHG